MKDVPLKSKRLQTLLMSTIDDFYSGEILKITNNIKRQEDTLVPEIDPWSHEYLQEALKQPIDQYGYPRACHGFGMGNMHPNDTSTLDVVRAKINRIGMYLGIRHNALIMGYPDNGYIGWHHNGNAPGYNILLSYSQDGDSYFEYMEWDTKKIVRLQDQPGWNVRVGYYPNQWKEKEKLFWHCAWTRKHRVTIAYVIDHKEMWLNMINEISGGEFDVSVL